MNSSVLPDPSEIVSGASPLPPARLPDTDVDGMADSVADPVEVVAVETIVAAATAPAGMSKAVRRHLVTGTSALGLSVLIERGTGFVANILAARLGGAATFGAYSLAITTANNIATYAAAQIGSTAARFSGKYKYGTLAYGTLARVLVLVSVVSALLAAAGLWLGAVPLAHLLGKPALTRLLHWAALSAAGYVLLECARGFFVGQRRILALVTMSLLVGSGMLLLVPFAASRHSPVHMIISQGTVTSTAVVICLLLAVPLGLRSRVAAPVEAQPSAAPAFRPMLREVWGFGFVQLAGLAGTNIAGWWLTTLVARADTSLVQMGFFGIASQLRNIAGLVPGLLTEGSYAVMADPEGEVERTPQFVLGLTTYVSSLLAMLLAGIGIVFAPWLLRLLYTSAYTNASVTVAVALALAVMHMGNSPASARLSIVSIRWSGVVNTVWAIVVAVAGTVFMLHGGNAARAMTIYLAAHTLSSGMVLVLLARKDGLTPGLTASYCLATGTTTLLAALAALRAQHVAGVSTGWLTLVMLGLLAAATGVLIRLGRKYRWVPSRSTLRQLQSRLWAQLRRVWQREALDAR